MTDTALVFGASGLVGQQLLPLLIAEDAWRRVIVVGRRSLTPGSAKVVEVIRDSDSIAQAPQVLAADTVFCCLGTTHKKAGGRENFRKIDHDYIVRCATIAYQQGARHLVVVSSIGAKVGATSYYSHVKGETERDLRAIGYDSLAILQPSLLLGARSESRPAEKWAGQIFSRLDCLLVGPLRQYRPIQARQVARAMAAIALQARPGVTVYTSDQLASI